MNSKLRFDGALSDGADEVDLDFVRKLVIQPIFASDSLVSPSKKRRYLTGVELRRIEWWDKSKASEVVTFAIFGNPKEVIRNLVLYRKEHKFNSFWSDVDKKGIQVVTAEEERAAESEHGRKATKWFFADYLPSIASTADEAKALARKAKPTRHYVIETLIVAVVCTLMGLFIGEEPSRLRILLPVEIAAVFLIVAFYGRVEEWFRTIVRTRRSRKKS